MSDRALPHRCQKRSPAVPVAYPIALPLDLSTEAARDVPVALLAGVFKDQCGSGGLGPMRCIGPAGCGRGSWQLPHTGERPFAGHHLRRLLIKP